ncbi:hypothetical protein [Streptomyces decoyicus]|uniref:hypothetical protein n=1 Tax=Streptomyces decoyicus TaxID=249567 RepID=UPI00339F4BB8
MQKTVSLSNGVGMPLLGFGAYQISAEDPYVLEELGNKVRRVIKSAPTRPISVPRARRRPTSCSRRGWV